MTDESMGLVYVDDWFNKKTRSLHAAFSLGRDDSIGVAE
jgi:hypothetical protein